MELAAVSLEYRAGIRECSSLNYPNVITRLGDCVALDIAAEASLHPKLTVHVISPPFCRAPGFAEAAQHPESPRSSRRTFTSFFPLRFQPGNVSLLISNLPRGFFADESECRWVRPLNRWIGDS
jgi:hypothetical protein